MNPTFVLQLLDSNPEDVDIAQQIFEDSLDYLHQVEGIKKVPDNAASEYMEMLPKGVSADQKRSFALVGPKGVVAYYEYFVNFPTPGTCYLALLLVPEKFQGKGYGRQALELIEAQMKLLYKAQKLRLAYVACTKSGKFWQKMGFKEVDQRAPYEFGSVISESVFMEKKLDKKI